MATKFRRSLVWFRRDLRLSDHPALHQAVRESEEVIPVYITSRWEKHHRWTGAPRQAFLCGCLESLSKNIAAKGGELIFRQGAAVDEITKLARETGADALYFNRDVDPFGTAMETSVREACAGLGLQVFHFKDAVLHEKDEVLTGGGGAYRVYTPYSRNWIEQPKDAPASPPRQLETPPGISSVGVPTLATWGLKEPGIALPEPGERSARKRMTTAVRSILPRYAETRNTPEGQTTSRLSQDLRFGLISIRELYSRCQDAAREAGTAGARKSIHTFIKELAWREFYMALIGHFPEVLEHEFNPDWRGLPWAGDGTLYDAWCEGQTGFPIVDAGMRELNETGFMHNRVRMIVSMFLTKDLHIDWRLGEQYFMQRLVDGEIASNNGGWQWSAGTGADAAPYFRIQNPWSQTKSYDPGGAYIKRWVPELANATPKQLITPPAPGMSVLPGYTCPIVDHKTERENTLAIFKAHRERG